jgi:SET domain-containing protein
MPNSILIQTEIKESQIDRQGVFTLEFLPKGKILSIWRNFTLHTEEEFNTRQDYPFSRNAVRIVGKYYGFEESGTIPEDFMNHSDEPNVFYFMGIWFALKDILVGEELLVDYNDYFALRDRDRFKDIKTGRRVKGLTARDSMLRSCQIMTELLKDLEDWDGM